ncbi:MAG TPA: asparagine synthase (glutamine-hydrolyzing) [Steroidobacteraceae bacterium]|nr:asparagine synthase (glutamine-hydrolyzing) [Steroidobacteraceae bacterium]
MCGIVGYAGRPGALPVDLLTAMRDQIAHRGPDAAGIWSSADGSVVLGHRRLAILDLSPAGSQPMTNHSGTGVIVFNGEIYNHGELRPELEASGVRFTGRSDTEVLLAAYDAWGEHCVERLRGMFAFAIYDHRRNTLFMARDRAGEKPLYWAEHRGGLVFASELKALMVDPEFPRRLSSEGLAYYLSFGYVPGEKCILEGVHKLMAGHCLTWPLAGGAPRLRRYWDIPAPRADDGSGIEELTDELQRLLTAAVSEQLIADVPLAVLLSGGVDSSLVTAIAARASAHKVRTFTVTLPDDPQLDERRFARTVAEYLHTDHVELPLDQSSVDLIDTLAAQYDEPIADSSMIPTYLLARTVSRRCKVVLGGDGGDELFGGYPAYQAVLRREPMRRALPAAARSVIAAAARRFLQGGVKGRNTLMAFAGTTADGIAQAAVWTDDSDFPWVSPWLARRLPQQPPRLWRRDLVEVARGLPGAAMAADFRSYLPEDILVKVDRASMLCSLEVRAPFLDSRIIEFAYDRVPNRLRVTPRDRKILLKSLARRLLPPELDIDRKQGFTIPISKWLTPPIVQAWRRDCREQIEALLSDEAASLLMQRRRSVAAQHNLYALILLTSWMRQYRVSL